MDLAASYKQYRRCTKCRNYFCYSLNGTRYAWWSQERDEMSVVEDDPETECKDAEFEFVNVKEVKHGI